MSLLKRVEIEEKRLEEILYKNPEYLEEGLKPVGRQFPTDSGPLDLLYVDENNVLVVVELKNEENDYQLLQALRYYDYISEHIYELVHHFKNRDIPISDKNPRLMLVAPSFSDTLKKAAKYLGIKIELKEYIAVKISDENIGLIIQDVELPGTGIRQIPTIGEKLDGIQSDELKELARSIFKELEDKGVELKPIYGIWISLFYLNKKLAQIGCRKTRLVVQIPSSEGKWEVHEILNEEDWSQFYQNKLKTLMDSYSRS